MFPVMVQRMWHCVLRIYHFLPWFSLSRSSRSGVLRQGASEEYPAPTLASSHGGQFLNCLRSWRSCESLFRWHPVNSQIAHTDWVQDWTQRKIEANIFYLFWRKMKKKKKHQGSKNNNKNNNYKEDDYLLYGTPAFGNIFLLKRLKPISWCIFFFKFEE